MLILALILSILPSLMLYWYFFKNVEKNSYLKNVTIYAIITFMINILSQTISGESLEILSSLLGSIIGGLIFIKVMEFARKQTNSFIIFIILMIGAELLFRFLISLLLSVLL